MPAARRRRAPSGNDLRLFPRQVRFVGDPRAFPAYIGGIGSGKSFAGSAKVIWRISRPKQLGMIGAPTYPMLRDSTLRGFDELLELLKIRHTFHRGENVYTFPNGSEVLCRSLDNPNSLRGPNLNFVWIDEGGYVSREGWLIVKGRARVGEDAQAWLTSTPKGRNWIWEEWERDGTGDEKDPTHPLYRVTTYENPELPKGFAEGLGYTGRFAEQELSGQFVAFEGIVYPGFSRQMVKRRSPEELRGWRTVLGVDIGTRNPTAILTIRAGNDTERHIERELHRAGMSSSEIVAAIIEEAGRSDPEAILVDPSAAAYIADLRLAGLPVKPANNAVTYGIGKVTTALAEGFTIDPECVQTIAEFESYHYPENRRETDAPVKEKDHSMDAARYALVELAGPETRIEPMPAETLAALAAMMEGM